MRKLELTTSVIALLAMPAAAWAQAPQGAGEDGASNADIIVTANKREQNLQDTPVAVSVVSDDQLKALNIVTVTDIGALAPSVNFAEAPSPTSSSFIIRGIGTFAFNDALEQSVGIVIDGVPQARLIGSIADAVDIGQIQVLRGPQGTIFGKNATAGVIDVAYRDANFTPSVEGRLFYGSYKEMRAQATVNMPLSDAIAIRATGWYFERDGFIDARFQPDGNIGGFERYGVRLKVAMEPTDNWRIDLTGEYKRDMDDGSLQTLRGYLPTPRDQQIQALEVAAGLIAGPNNRATLKDFPEENKSIQKRLVLKSVWDMGGNSLTGVVGYNETDFDGIWDSDFTDSRTFAQGSIINNRQLLKQVTAELRFASEGTGPLQYTLGVFFYDFDAVTHFDAQNLLVTGAPSTLTSTDLLNDIHTRNYAAFADVSYTFGRVTLLAGGRVSHERTDGLFDRGPSRRFIKPNVLFGPFHLENTITYDDFSWRGGFQWTPVDDVMIYGTAARAYKGPGFNYTFTLNAALVAANGGYIREEIGKSYELGVRSQFFDRQLTLNLTGFYSPFTNFQVTSVIPTVPPTFSTTNAPEVTAKGMELEFNIRPRALAGFTLGGNVVYNDTTYKDFRTAPCFVGQPQVANPTQEVGICAPITAGSTLFVQNVTGLRTVGVPPWQVNLTARYETPIGARLNGFGQVNYSYNGDIQYSVGNPVETIQPAYSLVNLTAGIGARDETWKLSVYARNVFDQHFVGRIAFANPGITQSLSFQALQTFGASLDFKF